MERILVSVILPVYGVEKWLPACLESILGQSLKALEILAIDDASPDRCGNILDDYAARDSRVRVFHLPENCRQGFGRNLGLDRAEGKYVYFLDSDDMIQPDTLEALVRAAEKDTLDGLFFDSEVIFEDEAFRKIDYEPCRKGRYEERVYTGPELFSSFWAQDDWNVYVWRQFWRRAFLQEEGIRFTTGEHEDEVFSVAAAALAGRVRYLPARYPVHRYRAASVMTRAKTSRDFHGYFMAFRTLSLLAAEREIRLPAYDANLAHLYELVQLYHPLFLEEGKTAAWFRDPEELRAYQLYAAGEKAHSALRRKIRTTWKPLLAYEHVFLFGAGKIARRVIQLLEETEVRLEGVIVTSQKGNASFLGEYPVKELKDWDGTDSTAVVIAVAPALHEEIAEGLREKNCTVYRYIKGQVFSDLDSDP